MVVLIVVDSNIWIFLNIENVPEHSTAEKKIEEVRQDGILTNIVIVSEVFHQLSKMLGKDNALTRVKKILDSSDVTYVPVEETVTRNAINLAGTKHLRINDAIIGQQASELNVAVLTDNVKDFRKLKNLRIIPLSR
ncbi:MAG: PIN domain-containing protein [Candidatus Aenigmarchaeota archaeon]|nr:PIN domain-containing protein [Candidatus Aenigmarchaeota archaeon]